MADAADLKSAAGNGVPVRNGGLDGPPKYLNDLGLSSFQIFQAVRLNPQVVTKLYRSF